MPRSSNSPETLLRRWIALLLATLACALPAAASAAPPPAATAMLSELNAARASAGLAPLRLDGRMGRNAAAHARGMARSRVVAHGAWTVRVVRSAGRSAGIGEVIGWLSRGTVASEAASLVRIWLASPVHRSALLDARFRRVGVGRATGTLFGTRAAIYTVDFAAAR